MTIRHFIDDTALVHLLMTDLLTIKTETARGIEKYLHDLAELRIEVFREFPYLYDGSLDYEKTYLETYFKSDQSVAVLVFDGDQLVGASTGLPLDHEEDNFKRPFLEHGYDPATIFYCGESILKKEYRGRGIYRRFFEERESHARQLNGIQTICFCAVQRPDDHPLRPESFQSLDPIWQIFGYKKRPWLTTTYRWKDVDEESETDKTMVFWMKEIE